MRRREACRLILGLLLVGGAGCGRSSQEKPITIPVNRFPGGRAAQKDKDKDAKKAPADKGGG